VTIPILPVRLKARLLEDAVHDNLAAIHGRPPESLRPVRRRGRLWSRRVGLVAFPAALVVASAGAARSSASVQKKTEMAPPLTVSTVQSMPVASLLTQHIRPAVLALGVRRVIVDAGHGGSSAGTSSASGLREKDLTLDIAERLSALIVKQGLEAVMTRTGDETLSLSQRAVAANSQRGDIFVSIHLNSLQPSSARGIETYYLGLGEGSDVDAIAAEENQHSGYSLKDMRSMLERIYADARRDESRRLAESVQIALVGTLRRTEPAITDRGVKSAPFVVLVATQMPAILAEVSCLSNAEEAGRLNAADYRQTIAEALMSGIQAFAVQSRVSASERTGTSGN
jgi:N-acetylmuramoyl-L-alanine amidase